MVSSCRLTYEFLTTKRLLGYAFLACHSLLQSLAVMSHLLRIIWTVSSNQQLEAALASGLRSTIT